MDHVHKGFARQAMMETIGAEMTILEPGTVQITAPVGPGFRQQQGYGHAGLTFTLGDTAAGFAAVSLMPEGSDVVTVEMKINLIAPSRNGPLRAVGRVVKPGRKLMIVTADVYDQDTHIAILQGTMFPLPAKDA